MTQTRVDITARDLTARAFTSVDNRLGGLAGGVRKLTGLFTALGAGISVVGATQTLRGIIDAQDQLAKLSQSTGIAVESLAGLEFAASQSGTSIEQVGKGVRRFSRLILESVDGTDKYGKLIRALGLDLERLKQATPEEQFISLAGAIRDNVSEQERAVVVTSLFGNEYANLVPLLSQGEEGLKAMIAEGRRLNGVTAESAAAAEVFNDNLDTLGRTAKSFGIDVANTVLPALVNFTNQMVTASREGSTLSFVLENVLKGLSGFGSIKLIRSAFDGAEDEADKVAGAVGGIRSAADKAAESVEDINLPNPSTTAPRSFRELLDEINEKSNKVTSSVKSTNNALSEQERQIKRDADEIERLSIRFDPLIAYNKELNELIRLRALGLPDSIYSTAVAEAINKYVQATGAIADGITEIDDRTQQIAVTTQQVLDSNEQIWISGIRSTQNALADGLFNFFDDGLKGMLRSVRFAVGRITSEFLSVRALQATGLFGLSAGSGAALASGGGGVSAFNLASAGAGVSNLFSSGFGIPGALGGGLQSLGTSLGSQGLSNFGAGLAGDLLAAGPGAAGSLGASLGSFAGPAAIAAIADIGLRSIFGDRSIGGTAGDVLGFVPIVGTLINGLFGRGAPRFRREELVGNVTAGGFQGVLNQAFRERGSVFASSRTSNFIADTDTGNFLNQFGRLSESGNIPGSLRDAVSSEAARKALEVGELLDETFISLSDTLRNTADILGISSESLKTFSAELDLISEKGEALTEAQVSQAIADISNQMVESLIPSIDEISRSGETATDTLVRIGAEFSALETALIVAGQSADTARQSIQELSFDQRTAFTDRFGGADALNAQVQNFFDNVLDESQQLEIVEDRARSVAESFGLDFIPTLDQLAQGFKDGSAETKALILENDDLIIQYQGLKDAVSDTNETIEEAIRRERALAKERNEFTAGRREVQAGGLRPTIATTIQGRIFTEDQIREQQQASVDRTTERLRELAQEQIERTLTAAGLVREQLSAIREANNFFTQFKEDAIELAGMNFTAARQQVQAATELARAGAAIELIDTPELAKAIDTLKEDRSAFFSSRFDFEKERAQTVREIEELSLSGQDNAREQIDILTNQLTVLEQTLSVQESTLNAITGVQTGATPAGALGDIELQAQLGGARRSAFEALRIQSQTSFNGSVRFADAFGANQSADAAALRQFGDILNPQGAPTQNAVIESLRTELKELRKATTLTQESQDRMYNFFLGLSPDGQAIRTTT